MKKSKLKIAISIAFCLAVCLVSLALVVFAEGEAATSNPDKLYYAADCVIADETNPVDAIMEQSFNGKMFSRFDATEIGQYITYGIDVEAAGEYKLYVTFRVHGSCGKADLYLNGEYFAEVDNSNGTNNSLSTLSLGKVNLKEGLNTLKFVVTGANPNPSEARKYFLNMMSFEIRAPKTIEQLGLPTVALPDSVSTTVYSAKSTDKVTVYPFPSKYTRSQIFTVTADGLDVPVRNFMNGTYDDYDYGEFTMKKGPVTITVTVPANITSYSITPKKLGIDAKVSGKTLTFTLERDEYLILKINNYKELVLTVDPPETDIPPSSGVGIFNVVSETYRADNTGKVISTGSLQKAIDDASSWGTANNKAGIVYVPAGVYLTGTIALKSNVYMYLEGGAVLYCTGRAEDYIQRAFKNSIGMPVTQMIYVYNSKIYDPYEDEFKNTENDINSENIKIYGRGTVDARGKHMENEGFLMQTLVAYNCKNFTSDGITYCDTNIWSIIPGCSEDMVFKNLKVLNAIGLHENDAIDVDNCKNVLISNAIGIALDDPFSVKTYAGGTEMFRSMRDIGSGCENVVFEDCLSWTICYGFKTGQGAGYDQIDIVFRDGVVYDCSVGIGVNHKYGGGTMTNITFENIEIEHCTWTNGPLQNWMDIECISGSSIEGVDPVKNVVIKNIKIYDKGKNQSFITGYSGSAYPEGTVNGVYLSDIYMPGSDTPATTLEEMNILTVADAKNICISEELASSDMFTPHISYKNNGATHTMRVLFTMNMEKVGKLDNLTVKFEFKGSESKTVTKTLSTTSQDFDFYRTVVAGDKLYSVRDGSAIFGGVITGIPQNVWETLTVSITTSGGETLVTKTVRYSDYSSGIYVNPDGEVPSFEWSDL